MSANPSPGGPSEGEHGAETSLDPSSPGERLLVAVNGPAADSVLDLGVDVALDTGAELYVLYPVSVPEQTPYSTPTPRREAQHAVATQLFRLDTDGVTVPVEGLVRLGRTELDALESVVDDYEVTTVLRERLGSGSVLSIARRAISSWRSPGYDTVVATGLASLDEVDRILVAIAGGPHSGLAVDVAASIARSNDSWLDLCHVVPEEASEARRACGEDFLDVALERVDGYERADTWLLEADDAADAIVHHSPEYDMTVLGTPQKGKLREFVFGSTAGEIRECSDSSVLTVQRNTADGWMDRWFGSDP